MNLLSNEDYRRAVLHRRANETLVTFLQPCKQQRPVLESEERRYEFDRIELGDYAAAFTDLHRMPHWFVQDWTERHLGISPRTFKKVRKGASTLDAILIHFWKSISLAREEGGEEMAKSISVNEILKQAKSAQEAYENAVEQRKNVKKVAQTLAAAGLLDDEDMAKVEEIFPKRAKKDDDDAAPAAE